MPASNMPKRFSHSLNAAAARREVSQTIALQALTFLLSEPRRLVRFLDETGLSPNELRANAQSASVLEAALTVMVNGEALLLTVAANAGLAADDVVAAHADIAGHDEAGLADDRA